MEQVKEMIRRLIQLFSGCFIFDCPGLNKIRNIVYRCILSSYGRKNVISKKVMFYVPHGLKKAEVVVGGDVRISENVSIDCSGKVLIGDNVWISENSLILNHEHIINGKEWKKSKAIELTDGIKIGDDVWVGANVTILPQVSYIGNGAIIGAGSVVTKDVLDFEIVAGNPARKIGERG